jgi:hypothetical protein
MEVKRLFILDNSTEIKAIALRPTTSFSPVMYAAGFDTPNYPYVFLIDLAADVIHSDPYRWYKDRTLFHAHSILLDHWDSYSDNGRLDVRDHPAYLKGTHFE